MEFVWRYTGLRVLDLDAAKRFFVEGLGMRVRFQFRIAETGGRIVELVTGDGKHYLELNWYPPGSEHAVPYEPGEALDHLAFRVKRGTLREAIARLEASGGKLRIPPFVEGAVALAYVDSPDGHTIELVSGSKASKAAAAPSKPAPRLSPAVRAGTRAPRRAPRKARAG